jgi:hypothetical protein
VCDEQCDCMLQQCYRYIIAAAAAAAVLLDAPEVAAAAVVLYTQCTEYCCMNILLLTQYA